MTDAFVSIAAKSNQLTTPLLANRKNAAAMLDISERAFSRAVARGDFPHPIKIGRSARWKISDIIEYLDRDF